MLLEPAIEKMSEKAGNKYKLCNLVAKRAKLIQRENFNNGVNPEKKEIQQALEELENGSLTIDEE